MTRVVYEQSISTKSNLLSSEIKSQSSLDQQKKQKSVQSDNSIQIDELYNYNNKPIDIILNHRFLEGKCLNPTNAIDIFDGSIYSMENEANFQDLHNNIDNQDEQYKEQRPIFPQDGILHYYSSVQGKKWIDKEKNIFENKIQMLVSITMYNEDYNLLSRSLGSIQKNLKEFEKIGVRSDQVVVVVIQDGIEKINEGVIENIFDKLDKNYHTDEESGKNKTYRQRVQEIKKARKYISNKMNKKKQYIDDNNNFPANIPKNVALLYQGKYDALKDPNYKTPLNIFFCNKHLNGKKLSSHTWLFQGFCRQFWPKYVTLMDCGTQVDNQGIVEFYKTLENDKSIGGCSGNLNVYYDDTQELQLQGFKYDKLKKEIQFEKQKDNKLKKNIERLNKKIEEKEANLNKWSNSSWDNKFQEHHFRNYFLSLFQPHCTKDEYHRKDHMVPQLEKELQELKNSENKNNLVKQQKQQDKKCLIVRFVNWVLSLIFNFFVNFQFFFDIRKAQENEYLMSQITDRRYESFFNFLVILPGAWCCYRLDAVFQEHTPGQPSTIEEWYLRPVINKKTLDYSMEEQNILLGEDRVLTLATFLQKNCDFKLQNAPSARAQADAVDNFTELMLQRRRWINATWFQIIYVLETYIKYMRESKQPLFRKYFQVPMMLFFQFMQQMLAYVNMSMKTYLLYNLLTQYMDYQKDDSANGFDRVKFLLPGTVLALYILTILALVLTCLNYKVNKSNDKYRVYAFLSGILSIFEMGIMILLVYSIFGNVEQQVSFSDIFKFDNYSNPDFIIANAIMLNFSFILLPFFCSLLEFNWKSVKDLLQILVTFPSRFYFFASSQYVFLTYGFCNIDDLSWGTKGALDNNNENVNKNRKNSFVLKWGIINVLVFMFFLYLGEFLQDNTYLFLVFICMLMSIEAYKCLFASIGMLEVFLLKRPYYFIRNYLQKSKQIREVDSKQSIT